jgi:cysteine synthase A
MQARAKEIADEVGGFQTDQFHNEDMVTGYRALGEEVAEQLDGQVDAWVGYVGTAGCFCGVTRALRERIPDVERVAVEPAESAVLSGRPAGTHRIEGGGVGFWPPLLRTDDFDEVIAVSTAEAMSMARRATHADGLWSGPSSGANLVAALEVARRLGPGRRVASVLVDSGMKYLAGGVYA